MRDLDPLLLSRVEPAPLDQRHRARRAQQRPGRGDFGDDPPSPFGSGESGAQEERIRAIVDCGLTERQVRFLVLVMRHGGVCIPRKYAGFAGIANGGRRCNAFFDKLEDYADVLGDHAEFVAEIVERFPVCYPLTELSVIRHEPNNCFLDALVP
jgi:hypothetical protein